MATQQPPTGKPSIKVAGMASAGAAVEWYDFFIYGTAAALVFPKLFFSPDMPLFVAQMAAFSTFAVGFIARPLGGAWFGHFGDRHGRKKALVLAMFVMGLATTLIGCLPSYATAGSLAPILLVVLRFLQGLAVGGQWGGAALLAIESAPKNRQGFYSSFVQVGVPLGVVLANTVFLIVSASMDSDAFLAWGWRIGFLISIALIFIGLLIHWTIDEPEDETPAQPAADTRPSSPLATLLREHWRVVLLAGGAFIANNVCFYIAITYAVAYGTTSAGIAREVLLGAVMIGSLAMIPALVVCGALSDRFGRRGIFMLGAVLCGAWAFIVFPLIELGTPIAVTTAIATGLICISLMYGPQAALFAELFPKEVRYSGASLGYQIGSVVGGGFAPIVATALFAHYGSSLPISLYLAATCVISLVCVILLGKGMTGEARHA
ncbi:MAG: MHS family MFS transporter [Sphingomonas sp.]|uniref:MFS transporter n=1 Tax=Sphingomonas sp. TaxID=28214 RepID=UPI0025F45008|nr:MFS transporter [Sphingomonas sp.]MBX3564043.1 MHS family MFS transporter [Sphingomonas sp.]